MNSFPYYANRGCVFYYLLMKKKNQRQKLLIRCDLEAYKKLARLIKKGPKKEPIKKKLPNSQCAFATCNF